ncbi:hypothetical protein CSUI_006237, partial [Cystoisospora suis]
MVLDGWGCNADLLDHHGRVLVRRDNELFFLSDGHSSALNVFFAVFFLPLSKKKAPLAERNGVVVEATAQLASAVMCVLRSCLCLLREAETDNVSIGPSECARLASAYVPFSSLNGARCFVYSSVFFSLLSRAKSYR